MKPLNKRATFMKIQQNILQQKLSYKELKAM